MFQVMIMHVDGSKLYKQGVVKMPRVKRHYLFTAAAPSTDSVADTTESSSVKASRPAPCCTRNTSSCSFCNFSLAAFNSLWQAEIWKELKLWAGHIAPSLQWTSYLHRYMWYCALSLHYACIQSSGIILIPYAKFRFFRAANCWASPWGKIAYVTQSVTQSINHLHANAIALSNFISAICQLRCHLDKLS